MAFEAIKIPHNKECPSIKVAYIIRKDPYMVVGSDTYIDAMLSEAGFSNVFSNLKRYPTLDRSELSVYRPDVVLLSSEPYPFSEKHYSEFMSLFPSAYVTVVNGEPFSWYGSRMLKAPEYFNALNEKISKNKISI